jgi:D-cysteine desulfhydrase
MDRSAVLATKIRTAFAPCSLGTWPAPLEAHPALARALGLQALWLKREDLTGGNKVRGLEFLLAGAPPRSVFVTIGAAGSSHCLATARCAKSQGYRTAVATFPQPETDVSRAVAAATGATANLVVRATSVVTLPWAVLRAWRAAHHLGRGTPHWIPGGGADPRAVIGHFLATLELGSQLDAPPDAIVVPLGTGGTAAGIALGVAWLGWSTDVVAARVASRLVANRWRTLRLARKTAALIRRAGIEFSVPRSAIRVRVVGAMGKGYGHPTPEGERARSLAAEYGLRLDPTYGAKAFSYFQQAGNGTQRAIFWHTFAWP